MLFQFGFLSRNILATYQPLRVSTWSISFFSHTCGRCQGASSCRCRWSSSSWPSQTWTTLLTFHSTSDTDSPSKAPDLGVGEAAGSALLLLNVEGDLAAPPAQRVRLVASLSKGAGSLGHLGASHHYSETCGLLETGGQRSGLKIGIPSHDSSQVHNNWGSNVQNFSFWKNHLEDKLINVWPNISWTR